MGFSLFLHSAWIGKDCLYRRGLCCSAVASADLRFLVETRSGHVSGCGNGGRLTVR